MATKAELCEDEELVKTPSVQLDTRRSQSRPGLQQLTFTERQRNVDGERQDMKKEDRMGHNFSETIANGQRDVTLCSPPKTENEVLQTFTHALEAATHTHFIIILTRITRSL